VIESVGVFFSARLGQNVTGRHLDSDDPESCGFTAGAHAVLENVRTLGAHR
jgi:hypothetical protein